MKPIPPEEILERGLAIFVTISEEQSGYPLQATLKRSNFIGEVQRALANCPDTYLVSFSNVVSAPYALILYPMPLEEGYYTLTARIITLKGEYKGEVVIGILPGETKKVIGSPYSVYPPLELR